MKRRIVFLSLVFLFILSVSAPAVTLEEIQARGYVKVGIYPGIPDFTYRDDSGNFEGFDVDMMKAVAKQWGVRIKWVPLDAWADNIPGLVNRRFDIFVAPFTITPKRARLIAFALPHFNAGQVALARKDNILLKSYKDLVGKKACAVIGSTGEESLRNIKGALVMVFPTQPEAVEAVLNGDSEAFIIDRPIALGEVKNNPTKLKIAGKPFTIEYYGYAVNKEDTELLMQLNQAITILKEDLTYDKTLDKWF